jgi:hypothetical protein
MKEVEQSKLLQEIHNDLMRDSTEYCCYCGMEKVRFGCCGENHFERYSEMDEDRQYDLLVYELEKEIKRPL